MQVHANATTNVKQRQAIRQSSGSCGQLAGQYHVSKATVHRWKQREEPKEKSCRPQVVHYALSLEEEAFVLGLRSYGLPLDEVVETAESLAPHIRRASVHRLFVRHGVNRLSKKEGSEEKKPGTFKEYPPGFLHIDCFYLPKLGGVKRYCFVAVDRATRFVYLWVYEHKDKEAASDFLSRCLEVYPFTITKILTDNGREFTLAGFKDRYGTKVKTVHPFEQICRDREIEHRRTKPYTPQTNGLVERTNGLVKEGTTKKEVYTSPVQMIQSLLDWNSFYNFHRKHRRIGKITPYQAVCNWFEKQPDLFLKEPSHLLAYRSQSYET
jgi:transposase InsO family protein